MNYNVNPMQLIQMIKEDKIHNKLMMCFTTKNKGNPL